MNSKACQNCKSDFTITPDDISFYEKMGVPEPTFCPECRMIRRLCWRNLRSFYKGACAICKKSLITMYDSDAQVMCIDCYNGDAWDQYAHAKDIDWSQDFFSQLSELLQKQPRIFQYRVGTVVNSDYGNSVVNSKNTYMTFSVIESENIQYSESIDKSKDSMDCLGVQSLDQCSWNISSEKNYNAHFMVESHSCIDSYFLYDCTNCQNCCLSSNLRNQQYYFRNEKLSKEEYQKAVLELNLNTIHGFEKAKSEFQTVLKNAIHKYAQILSSQSVTGDYIYNSKNIKNSFDVRQGSEDIKNAVRVIACKDIQDCYAILTGELEYETLSGSDHGYKQISCVLCLTSKEIEYSLFCKSSSNCFGCVGLKNASYCILNKQYTKEEYEEIVPKLRVHMMSVPYKDSKGRVYTYGEFFPYEICPFSYNETLVQDYFPLTKEEILEKGYRFKDKEKKSYPITIHTGSVPDDINTVEKDILSGVIECAHKGECLYQCTVAFKINADELTFLKNKKLPLPTLCPNCRHFERLSYRNPYKLWTRQCMCNKEGHDHSGGCSNTFETSYSPERPEVVYCESCYQKEVI